MALSVQTISPEEQAQIDEMRAADTAAEPAADPGVATIAPQADDGAAAEAAAAQQSQQRQQMVPHAAMHEERERRKAVEAQLADERRRMQTLEERTNLLLQNIQPRTPATETPTLPDVATDPVGHIVGLLAQQQREIEAMKSGDQQRQGQMQQAQVITEIQRRAQAMEQQFVLETPDYADAVRHLMAARSKELELVGYRDPAERAMVIQQEGLGLAAHALQRGLNPAEVIYGLAQQRGYQASTAANGADVAPQPAVNGNGASTRVATIAAGQRQAGPLAGARGTAPQGLTAQRLLDMTDAEFAKAMQTPDGRALLGS